MGDGDTIEDIRETLRASISQATDRDPGCSYAYNPHIQSTAPPQILGRSSHHRFSHQTHPLKVALQGVGR